MEEVALDQPGHHLEGLGAARAHQAEHARDLAREHRQRVVLDHRRHAQVAHRQQALALRPHVGLLLPVERLREIAPHHRLHDALAVEVGLVVGHHMPAVAQHRDAVGQQQRLLERVRDEDHRHAARLEVEHQVEEVLLFLGREAGRGLVEDDDARLVQHRARDLHHLLLGRAEHAHGGGRVDVEIERLQELLRRDVDTAQPVEEGLLAQEQVLRHRHRRDQAGFLEHHRDALVARFQRRAQLHRPAFHQHLARAQRHHAGHHLGQRRLAGAVLAEQRVDLAAAQREVDRLDGGYARVFLGGLAQLEHGLDRGGRARLGGHGVGCGIAGIHRAAPCSSAVMRTRSSRPPPFEAANSAPPCSATAVMPWWRPSTWLCSEDTTWPCAFTRTTSP